MKNLNHIAQSMFMLALDLRSDTAPVRFETRDKIAKFAELPRGWHYGSGVRPSDETIARALEFHDFLLSLGFVSTDAFPGAAGEIVVTAYEKDHCLEVIAEANGSISIIHEVDEQPGQPHYRMSGAEARHLLIEIASRIWNTSGYSTRNISTKSEVALQASHLGIQAAMAAYRSSRAIAYEKEAQLYANTYVNSMHRLLENPWFSGNLMPQIFHPEALSNKKTPTPGMFATTTSST